MKNIVKKGLLIALMGGGIATDASAWGLNFLSWNMPTFNRPSCSITSNTEAKILGGFAFATALFFGWRYISGLRSRNARLNETCVQKEKVNAGLVTAHEKQEKAKLGWMNAFFNQQDKTKEAVKMQHSLSNRAKEHVDEKKQKIKQLEDLLAQRNAEIEQLKKGNSDLQARLEAAADTNAALGIYTPSNN